MVSCAKPVYLALESTLEIFGKPFHLGESAGQAQTMKLANNLLAAAAIALTSEAMVMGVKAGLDPKVMLEVLNAGSGRNSASQDKFPRAILPGTFDFGFATGLSYKDVRLCIDEAEALGVPMVCGAAVRQMLAVTNAMYGADSDFTSMCKVVRIVGRRGSARIVFIELPLAARMRALRAGPCGWTHCRWRLIDKVKVCLFDLIGCAFEAHALPWSRQARQLIEPVADRSRGASVICHGGPRQRG
jgi:hypothetical protein